MAEETMTYMCADCGKEYETEKKMELHCRLVHEKTSKKCDEC